MDVILDELVILGKVELGPKVEVALKVERVDLDVLTRNVELEDDIDPKVPPSGFPNRGVAPASAACVVCAVEKHLDSHPKSSKSRGLPRTMGLPPNVIHVRVLHLFHALHMLITFIDARLIL